MTEPPVPGKDGPRAELPPEEGPPYAPFWKTRAWWKRAGWTAIAVYLATGLAFLPFAVAIGWSLGTDASAPAASARVR